MTEEYKKNLIDYITNNLQETSPSSSEIIKEFSEIQRDKWVNYIPDYWLNFRYEGMIGANENTSSLSVLYGGFVDKNNNVRGIITLVNENFEPVKTFYEFSNGTSLRYIQYMKQEEDGTFYYIDDEVYSYNQRQQVMTSQKRFVMVNNFTIKTDSSNDYKLFFRTSYIIPDAYKNFYCHNMFKDPEASHYIFFGGSVDTTSINYSFRKLTIFGLKINVGEPNEWTSYVNQKSQSLFASAYAQFNSDSEVKFKCVYTPNLNNNYTLKYISKDYTGSTSDNILTTFNDYKPYIDEGIQKKQSVFTSAEEVYFVQNNQNWGNTGVIRQKYIGLYKYEFDTSTLTTIFEKYLGDYDYTYQEYIMIDNNLTDIYIEYINNYDRPNNTADYYIQRYNGQWNPILIAEQKLFVYDRRSFYAKNNYNLIQLYSYGINPQQINWFYSIVKEDYNITNYNGDPYVNSNVLSPEKVELYSNNKLVFARNLYNITKQNNQTMSSVEIPETYLNDISITNNNLISKTNVELNNNLTQWNKNIYEVVDLNFINTITIIDEDTDISYLNGAIKLNNAINDGGNINYLNTPCNKYRINYLDGTTLVNSIGWTSIDDTHKETSITVYINKPVISVDFISYDETTVYLNIPLNVTVGKYYTINQKIKVE